MSILLDGSFLAKSAAMKVSSVGRELAVFMSDVSEFAMVEEESTRWT